ncbi:MAG: glutamine synthetase [Gammaproteobacteria bacterium]|jgi:glutamine synthetase|nr:glutamine synthetase [Gammaproteobacteria bacterium]|tara:strand:+ start:24499 stop:25830 length:1332 start_codon:yes stop_codon:yes gene_type:complete
MSDIRAWLNTHQVKSVECLVPDFHGIGKGKIISAEEFIGGDIRFPESIFGQNILGKWCKDEDLVGIADIDMTLFPDEATLAVQPWSGTSTAQCICDCLNKDGSVFDLAPRSILKKVLALYEALGIRPLVAQEAEFYLVAKNPDPKLPLEAAPGISGRQPKTPRSFQMEAISEYSPFLETLYDYAGRQNVFTTGVVHEMGPGQLEVNFKHGDALTKADEMFNFKRIARQAALHNGYLATFLSKPISGEPGSAMHLHQSLVDLNSGKNLFANEDGSRSRQFNAYLGGLQKYTTSAMAFFAPNVNAYRRFDGAVSCPTNVEWGLDNRTTGFRVPVSEASATRVENRIPGSDANPYLVIAASLACGYLGLTEGLTPGKPVTDSAWDLPRTIPRSLRDSLDLLSQCQPLTELFGEKFTKLYAHLKNEEVIAFSETVTEWEREHLALTV